MHNKEADVGGPGRSGGGLGSPDMVRWRRIELTDRVIIITGRRRAWASSREGGGGAGGPSRPGRAQPDGSSGGQGPRELGAASVLTIPTDVTDQSQVDALVDRTVERHGRVDILVNNAGIIGVGPIETMTLDDFRAMMATHFWGPSMRRWPCCPT